MSPAVRAEHEINVTIGKIRMDKAGADDLLPIYAELDAFAEAEEVADVRIHVDRARRILESMGPKDREGYEKFNAAADELMEASTKINYLEMDLPVYETYGLLYRAHLALRHNDLKAADASLEEVEKHVRAFLAIAGRRGTSSAD
jgi:hypothetical protein